MICTGEEEKHPIHSYDIGYDVSNHDCLVMVINLEAQSWTTLEDPVLPEGVEARARDLENDDLVQVYDVLSPVRATLRYP